MLRKASRCALDPDGGKVAKDKDSCNDSWVDDGEVVAVNSADDACEDHVDRGGEEGGRKENEGRLNDKWPQCVSPVDGECSSDISNDLHCCRVSKGSTREGEKAC